MNLASSDQEKLAMTDIFAIMLVQMFLSHRTVLGEEHMSASSIRNL